MTIKIKVELTIKDKTVELTFEEAKILFQQLKPLFDKESYFKVPDDLRGFKEYHSDWYKPTYKSPGFLMNTNSVGQVL